MLNLVPAMREIEKKRTALKMAYEQQMAAYDQAYKVLEEMNEVCPRCLGEKKILRSRSCAEDDVDPNDPRDYETCPVCRGTGIPPKANTKQQGGEMGDFQFY